jgi:Htaa
LTTSTSGELFGLLWGVKETFRAYVARSPGSRIVVGHGAGVSASEEYFFGPDPEPGEGVDTFDGTGLLRFTGTVHFRAHYGFLSVPIVDPWVQFLGEEAILTVAPAGVYQERVRLARLRPADPIREAGVLLWPEIPARLHEDGVDVFGGTYSAGLELDPVRIRTTAV